MSRSLARELAFAFVLALMIAVLYRYWLIYPILQHLTITQWRLIAIFVAVTVGILAAFLRIRSYVWAAVVLAALLFGGALAFFLLPIHDVQTTFSEQFMSHLETLWREVALITASAAIGHLVCRRFIRKSIGKA